VAVVGRRRRGLRGDGGSGYRSLLFAVLFLRVSWFTIIKSLISRRFDTKWNGHVHLGILLGHFLNHQIFLTREQ
jgi:hypothetical protein